MNAISPRQPEPDAPASDAPLGETAERTRRHLLICRELIDIGMELIRLIAQRARQEAEAPEPEAAEPGKAPAPRTRDPILAFTRLSTAVRMAMVLETRIAEGPLPAARRRPKPPPDPRRTILRAAFEEGTERHPERKRLLRESLERLEEELADDQKIELTANDILDIICEDLGFQLNMAMVSDETLEALTGIPVPDFVDEDDFADEDDNASPGPPP